MVKGDIEIKEMSEENFYLKKIYEFMKINNRQNDKLENTEIEESLKMITDLVEDRYEH